MSDVIHYSQDICWSGRWSERTTGDIEEVTCKNCKNIFSKNERRLKKLKQFIKKEAALMSNEELLYAVLDLSPDDWDGGWTKEGLFERDIWISCLFERLGDWIK